MAGRVAVDVGALHGLATQVRDVAGGIGDLRGDLAGVADSFDEPPQAAAALSTLVATWRGAVRSLEGAVDALASGLDDAAESYAAADAPLTGGGDRGRP